MTKAAPTDVLKLDGDFYPRFIEKKEYSPEALIAIKRTVEQLLAQPTTASRPGMLLGKVQSGKTKTFMGAIALAFDNGFDVCVVLTKGTKALAKQTYERVQKEFSDFTGDDLAQVFDAHASVHHHFAAGIKLIERQLDVILVLDLAHDLFKNVLDSDDTCSPAVLVDDHRDMYSRPL